MCKQDVLSHKKIHFISAVKKEAIITFCGVFAELAQTVTI